MSIIIPAILVESREELDKTLARLSPIPQIEAVQIDIVDGAFASPPSWPYAGNAEWELPMTERFRYDLDLMIREPESSAARWIELGAGSITLHAESTKTLSDTVATFKKRYGHEAGLTSGLLSLGIALNIDTPLNVLSPIISDIDYVQLMGIAHIGRQGEPFDKRVIPKIKELRTLHPGTPVYIDGGVSLQSAPDLLSAGASRLIVGSALLRADSIEAELTAFESLGEQYGIYER
jgi:ribulose-phosphate 3-epimerase